MSEQPVTSPPNATAVETIVIADRFRGPPQSGNGGYVAGVAAALLDSREAAEVTLRSPIPLDVSLSVKRPDTSDDLHTRIWQGETLIAEVQTATLELAVPVPPDWQAVRDAAPTSPSYQKRINPILPDGTGFHPICFCCGVDHPEGLNVCAAPVLGGEQVAAIWNGKSEWADSDGNIPDEFVWTALDCPGQFAFMAGGIVTGLLGRITGKLYHKVSAGEEYLVTGWRIAVEGKKHFAGTAIFDRDNRLLGAAKSVWIGTQPSNPMQN